MRDAVRIHVLVDLSPAAGGTQQAGTEQERQHEPSRAHGPLDGKAPSKLLPTRCSGSAFGLSGHLVKPARAHYIRVSAAQSGRASLTPAFERLVDALSRVDTGSSMSALVDKASGWFQKAQDKAKAKLS